MMAELGRSYKCKVLGIRGVATARTEFLTGCSRACLEYVKDGEAKSHWVDEPMLEDLGMPQIEAPADAQDKGGPGVVAPSRPTGAR